MKKHQFKVQTKAPDGKWVEKYGNMETEAQAVMYYKGTAAFNGCKCRIMKGRKVIAIKGE